MLVSTVFNVSTYLLSKPVIEGHMWKSLGLLLHYLELLVFAKVSITIMIINYFAITVIHCRNLGSLSKSYYEWISMIKYRGRPHYNNKTSLICAVKQPVSNKAVLLEGICCYK